MPQSRVEKSVEGDGAWRKASKVCYWAAYVSGQLELSLTGDSLQSHGSNHYRAIPLKMGSWRIYPLTTYPSGEGCTQEVLTLPCFLHSNLALCSVRKSPEAGEWSDTQSILMCAWAVQHRCTKIQWAEEMWCVYIEHRLQESRGCGSYWTSWSG